MQLNMSIMYNINAPKYKHLDQTYIYIDCMQMCLRPHLGLKTRRDKITCVLVFLHFIAHDQDFYTHVYILLCIFRRCILCAMCNTLIIIYT